ncbi:MAG: hypothetical protein KAJ44_04785 [Thermoplasmatales archaeon]|nr:hypothetical protein [Thermoplasmatales archaeon]
MKNIDLKMIAKVILIAGIILCGVAQILPWGEFSLGNLMTVSFFHWGGLMVTSPLTPSPEIYFTPTDFSGIPSSPVIYGFAFGTLFLYFILPLCLISLIAGIVAYRKIGQKRSKNSLHAGVSGLMAMFSFISYIQLSYLSNIEEYIKEFEQTEGISLSSSYYWSPGFYLMIISAILFFISYTLIRRNYKEGKNEQIQKKEKSKNELKKEGKGDVEPVKRKK